jgi:hypothetical protein
LGGRPKNVIGGGWVRPISKKSKSVWAFSFANKLIAVLILFTVLSWAVSEEVTARFFYEISPFFRQTASPKFIFSICPVSIFTTKPGPKLI